MRDTSKPVARSRRRDPVEGDVYTRLDLGECRRVVGICSYATERHGKNITIRRVCYSAGGNANRWCSVKTFRKWFKEAQLTQDGTEKR